MHIERNVIANTDALTFLCGLPDESINCIVTSPPYYGLRDYGVSGQIGLEATLTEYINTLVMLFREAHRVLRSDGTLWLNLGDSYAAGKGQSGSQGAEHQERRNKNQRSLNRGYQTPGGKKQTRPTDDRAMLRAEGLKPKDLMMIPHRVAIALQDDGWYVRSDIVWHKPACMPESVTDRPTKSHEYIFLLSKSPDYYYDHEAIKEPAQDWGERDRSNGKYTSGNVPIAGGAHGGLRGTPKQDQLGKRTYTGFNERYFAQSQPLTRNKRSVWTVNPEPFAGAHFATFPTKLIEPCILAGCPHGGIVLDPFMGSGTTALVARYHGRDYLGSELNPKYVEIALERLRLPFEPRVARHANDLSDLPMFASQATYDEELS